MNKVFVAAFALVLAAAGQASAAQGAVSTCPARQPSEADASFSDRTHSFCEVRWQDLVGNHATAGQTHDEYLNVCVRKCAGDLGAKTAGRQLSQVGGGNTGYILGGLAVAGAIGGGVAASSGSSGPPASP